MSDLVWEDPPARGHRSAYASKWRRVATQLQQHPGKWARVAEVPMSQRGHVKRALNFLGAECTTRKNVRLLADVYARWPEDAA